MTFKTVFLHFDSANSKYISDMTNTSTVVANPYKAAFSMNQTFRRIKRVYLTSVECPIGFTNIRTGSTDTFTFILNGIPYLITLPEKNYTSIAALITDMNAIIATKVSGITMTLGQSTSITTPLRLSISFSSVTSFSIIDTNLSKYILGFKGSSDTPIGTTYSALSANWNLNIDNYISMHIPTLNGVNACMGNQISTFKIPLNSVCNQVYFYQEGNSFRQWVDITDMNLAINSLNVVIYDKFGKNIFQTDWIIRSLYL